MEKKLSEYDICIIGSGAGASPIAYELSLSGAKVCVLEKGEYYKREDFSKDEIAYCRREILSPKLTEEYHILQRYDEQKGWYESSTKVTGESFWNGSLVGGATNLMGGYFHRMHPKDFRLLSEFGKIEGANVVDWPIGYEELEPYYTKVERVVGISGKYKEHPFEPPRSSKEYPFAPLKEHPLTKIIDQRLKENKIIPLVQSRAIISKDFQDRNACYYSNFCANYGCSSGAKSSARESLLEVAKKSKNLTILTNSHVIKLKKNSSNEIKEALFIDKLAKKQKSIKAKVFVVACGAIESIRLLLNSNIANSSGEVGKNFIFGGINSLAIGKIDKDVLPLEELMVEGLFINRSIKDFYFLDEKTKGGVIDILLAHQNPIPRANRLKYVGRKLVFSKEWQKLIYEEFTMKKQLNLEVFTDFLPHNNCFVTISKKNRDIFGMPVAKVRISTHIKSYENAVKMVKKAGKIISKIGAKDIVLKVSPNNPPRNLQAGGCRFGDDPKKSVLNRFCQSHDHKNLFVTDGSFMPTGGSVPFTWTIYANSFRVADFIKKEIFKI